MIASLTPFKPDPLKKDWGSFRQMRELADVVIVACDGCHVFDWGTITGPDVRIDEVIETKNELGWEDYTMRLTLLARATAHKAYWCLLLDDDEVLQGVTRETMRDQVRLADAAGCVGITYDKREMWTETQYRNDGEVWKKRKLVLQKNPFMGEFVQWRGSHLQQLHAPPLQCGDIAHHPESRLLHYGMSSPALRIDRYRRLKSADPDSKCQPWLPYEYMLDETGLELVAL